MGLSSSQSDFILLKERALHHLQSPSRIITIYRAVDSFLEARLFISSINPQKDDNWKHVFELHNYYQHYFTLSPYKWPSKQLLRLAYHGKLMGYVGHFNSQKKEIQELGNEEQKKALEGKELDLDYKIGELFSKYYRLWRRVI